MFYNIIFTIYFFKLRQIQLVYDIINIYSIIRHIHDIKTINRLFVFPLKDIIIIYNRIKVRNGSYFIQLFIFLLWIVDLLMEFDILQIMQLVNQPHVEVTNLSSFNSIVY